MAQQIKGVPRVGLLHQTTSEVGPSGDEFREGMRALGWIEGSTYAIEERFANGDLAQLADDAAGLAGFYTGTQPVLRSDGDWRVLTPAGKQWYEERALMLLSRSE